MKKTFHLFIKASIFALVVFSFTLNVEARSKRNQILWTFGETNVVEECPPNYIKYVSTTRTFCFKTRSRSQKTQRKEPEIYQSPRPVYSKIELAPKYEPKALSTPEKVKGIYATGFSFASKKRRSELIKLIEDTELNTLVIDVRDNAGKLMFVPDQDLLKNFPVSSAAFSRENFSKILKDMQDKGIYTVARVVTFQDTISAELYPKNALKNKNNNAWYNYNGIGWLDPTKPEAWKIPLAVAKEAESLGFEEIQFDYIRFPSDGALSKIAYSDLPDTKPKHEVLTEFYKKVDEEIDVPISIDLFGFTFLKSNMEYDLNIGQRVIDAAVHFDFLSPMVYPSHYPAGYMKLENPAASPYKVVEKAMRDGNTILATMDNPKAKIRPWLQDFNMGAKYDSAKIKAQIKACDEQNTAGWILWSARNVYTEEALVKTPKQIGSTVK